MRTFCDGFKLNSDIHKNYKISNLRIKDNTNFNFEMTNLNLYNLRIFVVNTTIKLSFSLEILEWQYPLAAPTLNPSTMMLLGVDSLLFLAMAAGLQFLLWIVHLVIG